MHTHVHGCVVAVPVITVLPICYRFGGSVYEGSEGKSPEARSLEPFIKLAQPRPHT